MHDGVATTVPHAHVLATIALTFAAAFVGGALARRLGLSPIVGYLVAGIVVGPSTPGFVADATLATELAEIGIVLLMFGVGLHFSPRELASLRWIAIPGAVLQSAVATALGVAVGVASGWGVAAGLVLGLSISVASTIVLLRGLEDQDLLVAPGGRIAVGWLIVEDLFTVIVVVLLPALAHGGEGPLGAGAVASAVLVTVAKVGALVTVVLVAGRRVVPWLLDRVARLRSRELFTLAVLGIALGVAYGSARLAGVSMALGAFLAGMVVGQSDLSHRAAAEALPLRDAFAVLFFVSVGMLFQPRLLLDEPGLVLATLAIVLVAKPAVALGLVLALGHPLRTALTVAVGLAQIGEFSFILAGLGMQLGLLPDAGYGVVLAGAIVSITINPLLFRSIEPLERWMRRNAWAARLAGRREERHVESAATGLSGHVVLCGFGRVGMLVADVLSSRPQPFVVVEQDREAAAAARARGAEVVDGDAATPVVLEHAGIARARTLVLSFADPVAARLVLDHALEVNPTLRVLARVDTEAEEQALQRRTRVRAVMGERLVALELARLLLQQEGMSPIESEAILMDLRRGGTGDTRTRGTRLVEVQIPAASDAVGRRISELGLPAGSLVVLVERGSRLLVASGATAIAYGDRVLVMSAPEALPEVQRILTVGPVAAG